MPPRAPPSVATRGRHLYRLCLSERAQHSAQHSKKQSLLASVLQAASARDFLNAGALEAAPRGRDLLKLAHCRTDSSPARPTKTSNWEVGRGTPVLLGTCFAWERAGRAVGLPWYPTAEGPILGPRQHRPQTWPWGNDPPENGQYSAVGRQLSAHRPRLCPPEAVRGVGSRPTEVKRSRPTSAAIGGRDPRSRAATAEGAGHAWALGTAEPACGSHSRLVDSSAARPESA